MVMKKCAKAINVASSSVECPLWWPFPKVFPTTTTWFSSKYLGVWPQPKRRTYKPKYTWTFSALSWNIFSSFLVNRPRPPTLPWILIPVPGTVGTARGWSWQLAMGPRTSRSGAAWRSGAATARCPAAAMQCLCCWGNEKYEKWWIWSLWFNDDLMMIYWDIQICIYNYIYIYR